MIRSGRMTHAEYLFVALLFLGLLPATGSFSVWASIYSCLQADGGRILTDTPGQLQSCTLIAGSGQGEAPPSAARAVDVAPAPPKPAPPTDLPDASAPTPRAGTPTGPVIVPLQRVGHLFVASVRVNGEHEGHLIVDTGASHTVLSRGLAIRSGLLTGAPNGVTMNTVGGQVQAEVVRVNSIRVADLDVTDSVATIFDLPDAPPGVDGLLGLSFLGRFEVTLDAEKPQLLLSPSQK